MTITRRGEHSWRISYDIERDPKTKKRQKRYKTIRGTKQAAKAEETRLKASVSLGRHVDASGITVAEFMRKWVQTNDVTQTVKEHRIGCVENRIVPYLGNIPLQKLKPIDVEDWHQALLKGTKGRPLSPASISGTHRMLCAALQRACGSEELLIRNVALLVKPPRLPEDRRVRSLTEEQVHFVLTLLKGREIYGPVYMALATGARVGEIVALQWRNVDLDNASLTIEASVATSTAYGSELKSPKTQSSVRTISIPQELVEVLSEHRTRQSYARQALGLGPATETDFVFPATYRSVSAPVGARGGPQEGYGRLRQPMVLSNMWTRAVKELGLPSIPFHGLRHTHASALISADIDVVEVARRLGHSNPGVTLRTYSHAFKTRVKDRQASDAISAMLRSKDSAGCQSGAKPGIRALSVLS